MKAAEERAAVEVLLRRRNRPQEVFARARLAADGGAWARHEFSMYSTADVETPVGTRTRGDAYGIKDGNRRVPDIAAVPYLDVVSAVNRTGDKLTLFCVDRRLSGGTQAAIRVLGFVRGRETRVLELRAGSIFRVNDEWRPDAVRPRESRNEAGAEFRHLFPPASVTVIELIRRKGSSGTGNKGEVESLFSKT